jgi:dihydroorotate dehydrogenase electron transfer subunit
MLYDLKAKIVKNRKLTLSIYYLELEVPELVSALVPGQFLHVRILGTTDPLLRRPLSVNRIVNKKNAGIIYNVVGKGTYLLKEMAEGESVDVLGALGNGFDVKKIKNSNVPVIFAAGGMGIAPFVFLAKYLSGKKRNITAFVGTDIKAELVCINELKKLGCDVKISTDDGSAGFKGYVSTCLEKYLEKRVVRDERPYIYACGPKPMLKALRDVGAKYGLQGQVSLDEMMGCGLGACLGCVVKTKNRAEGGIVYKRICKDGPVFDINEIIWEE